MISSILFVVGAVVLVAFLAVTTLAAKKAEAPAIALPIAAFAVFSVISVRALVTEGFPQLLADHTRGPWSTQVWFDLLLASSIAWSALLPRARRLGMHVGLWAIALVLTGSLALLAMLARILYLEARPRADVANSP